MKIILAVMGGFVLGLGFSILSFKYLADRYGRPSGYFLEASYFVEVPKGEFEKFTLDLFRHLNEVRSTGYILGTSNMLTIRADGECGDDAELEDFLSEYVNGNQFVCFTLRRYK